jgi:hypothetical protein
MFILGPAGQDQPHHRIVKQQGAASWRRYLAGDKQNGTFFRNEPCGRTAQVAASATLADPVDLLIRDVLAVRGRSVPMRCDSRESEATKCAQVPAPVASRTPTLRHEAAIAAATVAIAALTLGAFAVGAMAIGRLAIGRLAIGQLALGRAKLRSGRVHELRIARLVIGELRVERAQRK